MNSLLVEAEELCKKLELDWNEELNWHVKHGIVVIREDCIVLARNMHNSTWFVTLAIGPKSLERFIDFMPYYLPWMRFRRGLVSDKLKTYDTLNIVRLICKKNYPTQLQRLIQST